MELIRKNIHMERLKCKAGTQVALADDVNISDNKPDAFEIISKKGNVKIEEIKATQDHVNVKGKLCFSVLYLSDEEERRLYCMEGNIPFEEQIYAEGIRSTDAVRVHSDVEDLQVELINSRKMSVQALLNYLMTMDELYDEEAAVEIYTDVPVEYRKKTLDITEIAVHKKDIFRIKEEIAIPQSLPNIFQVVWSDIRPVNVQFKLLDGKINMQGELMIFLMYEGEDNKNHAYETSLNFGGEIECQGCREGMMPYIQYEIGNYELETRPDFDGEERIVGIDMVLDFMMKLYENSTVDILADIYGVTKEIEPVLQVGRYRNILLRNQGSHRVSGRMKLKGGQPRMLQLCHSDGRAKIEKTEIAENGVRVIGTLVVNTMYMTGEAAMLYASVSEEFPFTYTMEVPGIAETCTYDIDACLEQLQISMLDSEELDVKAMINFYGIVFKNELENLITDVKISELDMNKLNDLPGIVGYVAKDGDTLWQIGRKYYVSIDSLREVNGLTEDELKPGDKILIVK